LRKGSNVDEQMIQAAAMEQMMGGGMGAPAGGMGAPDAGDPFASDAPPGYTMVYVPDAVLPAVMELVEQGDSMGAPGMMGGAGPAPAAPAAPPMF
jgi:hypothetical protein